MKDKSSEKYLDNLLNSITDTEPSRKKKKNGFRDIFLDDESDLETDDEFLRSFEAELESDSYKEYLTAFEREMAKEHGDELELDVSPSGVPDDIDAILKGIENNSVEAEEVPGMPDSLIDGPEAILSEEGIVSTKRSAGIGSAGNGIGSDGMDGSKGLDGLDERNGITGLDGLEGIDGIDGLEGLEGIEEIEEIEEIGDNSGVSALRMTDAGEVDLSGGESDDLLKMLDGSDEFGDIGDLLSGKEQKPEEGSLDEFQKFAMEQMEERAAKEDGEGEEDEAKEDAPKPSKGKKAKKEKKEPAEKKEKSSGGFFDKLKLLLFGEDEPEEEAGAASGDENEQILKEIEAEEKAKKAKKDKKKKEKKAKPAKPKKAPKPKKPPKPKKEKPPKEKDNTPPLPKGPVILIMIMAASMTVLVLLGTNLLNYSSAVSEAKEAFNEKDYTSAYQALSGESIQSKDRELYNKLTTLAAVSSEYDAYLIFLNAAKVDIAYDSLICAAGRCSINLENAKEYGCTEELEELRVKIEAALEEGFSTTYDEALEMYDRRNRTDYTVAVRKKLRALGLE